MYHLFSYPVSQNKDKWCKLTIEYAWRFSSAKEKESREQWRSWPSTSGYSRTWIFSPLPLIFWVIFYLAAVVFHQGASGENLRDSTNRTSYVCRVLISEEILFWIMNKIEPGFSLFSVLSSLIFSTSCWWMSCIDIRWLISEPERCTSSFMAHRKGIFPSLSCPKITSIWQESIQWKPSQHWL